MSTSTVHDVLNACKYYCGQKSQRVLW